ncbi:MAG: ribulose-phosphate 3-epimerase [Bacteroidota bacterium]
MSVLVSPSLLSANFLNLEKDVRTLNKSQADWIHIDVMDGVFVPNISFGFPVISPLLKISKLPLDVHLMIVEPDRYIERFRDAGAHILTVHYEACTHLHRSVQKIKSEGMKAGVSLNPHTPVCVLEDIITDVDLVLIMSVNPGYGGQEFIENSYAKIRSLKQMIKAKKSKALIEVDGGVCLENAGKLIKAGTDVLVAGNSIFKSKDIPAYIAALKKS